MEGSRETAQILDAPTKILTTHRTVLRAFSSCFLLQRMGVQGIATGTSFRRLVAKTLARQFSAAVKATCAAFQFALSTRAGVDCVGHAVRAATDENPEATVLSIDGVGAHDHVYRSAMMAKLRDTPSLQGLLPFVRSVYSRPSCHKVEGLCRDLS